MVIIDVGGLSSLRGKTGEMEFQRECVRRAMKGYFAELLGTLCIDVSVDFVNEMTGNYHDTCVIIVYLSLLGADKNDAIGETVLCSAVEKQIQGHVPGKMPYVFYTSTCVN